MNSLNSTAIKNRIELFRPALRYSLNKLFKNSHSVEHYQHYLILLHFFVRASVPLMKDALLAVDKLPDNDPFKLDLHNYLSNHVEEELDHDLWLLEDLEYIGVKRERVIKKRPSSHIAAMVGSQYYWIRHHHPLLLLGYIYVLEGEPPTKILLEQLEDKTGLPEEAFRTLKKHGELDPHHTDELDQLLDKLLLTSADIDAICISANKTIAHVVAAFEELSAVDFSETSFNDMD